MLKTKIKNPSLKQKLAILAVGILSLQSLVAVFMSPAHADGLTQTYVRMSRMQVGQKSWVRVVFQTPGSNHTENKLRLRFTSVYADGPNANGGSGSTAANRFTLNTGSVPLTTANCASETGTTALPNDGTALNETADNSYTAGTIGPPAVENTGKTLTIGHVGDLAVSTRYCLDIGDDTGSGWAITNPTTSLGQYIFTVETLDTTSALLSNLSIGTRIVTGDQVVVSAVVPPIFNLVLDGNTDAFASLLDPSNVIQTGGRTATITTNAAHGCSFGGYTFD
jgi:hypothetical protein